MSEMVLNWLLTQSPVVVLSIALWWVERKERLKLGDLLRDCLNDISDDDVHP